MQLFYDALTVAVVLTAVLVALGVIKMLICDLMDYLR